jgi:hypothetical protein
MMEDKRGSIPCQCSMGKLLKVNSSHAACVQASNGIMVIGKISLYSFHFPLIENIFKNIKTHKNRN